MSAAEGGTELGEEGGPGGREEDAGGAESALRVFTGDERPQAGLRAAERTLASTRERARSDHEARTNARRRRLAAHNPEHVRHTETLDTCFPISLTSKPSRIDVVVGTGSGWESPLATLGGPLTGPVLVEAGPSDRRVVLGDCDPWIDVLPRVSTRLRPSLR
ncbi:hypothetical protein Shyhy01_18970 [Streptomyces hygroscopicus subsp. hygroscopicus]|nr:hypothetical protein [Streptomyces hygroscopicus]GLX48947.1 hypothetical protein Shyhy01_18970 [Streptomyces hygroscopicus subsp. hygroscopicus]